MVASRSGRHELTDILLTGPHIDVDIQENVRQQVMPYIATSHAVHCMIAYVGYADMYIHVHVHVHVHFYTPILLFHYSAIFVPFLLFLGVFYL